MLKTESYKKGIILSTGFNIIVKGVVFLNTLIIAYFFGTSVHTDVYFYVFSVIVLIAGLINGMDTAVILPEGMHLQENEGVLSAMRFYNFFGYIYLLIGALLFLVLFFFSIPIYSHVSAFKTNILVEHKYLFLISSAIPAFLILSNYLTSILTTYKYFTAPLIASGIAQIIGLFLLIFFHSVIGISAMLLGLLGGYILNVFILIFFMRLRIKWQFAFSIIRLSKRIIKNLVSVQLGNLATFAFNYGIIILLSGLVAGVYSAYTYSMQIVNLPVIFVVMQTSAVAGIKFNELAAKNLYDQLNRIFQNSMGILLFLLIPICFLTWLYADVIVNILLFRGTFTKSSANTVVACIKCLIFLVPCLAVNTFLSRLLIAIKKVRQSFYYQVAFNIAILVAIFVFTKLFYLPGFLWSMVACYYIYITIVCIFLMKNLMPYLEYIKFLKSFLKIVLLNLPSFLIVLFFLKNLIFIAPLVYIILLLLINRIMKVIPDININMLRLTKV